uniref:Uncharacterized protein n=1 Tax=Kalanchoe fedtschenkoi TaxID=63787 RepID=A0A7N0U9I9_KALFE
MVLVAFGIGIHTAKHQILHSPEVKVAKKKRESVVEVEDPDQVVSSVDKYINNSFFRKVAHVQDHHHHDPARPDPFLRSRHAESLNSVGVDPKTSAKATA